MNEKEFIYTKEHEWIEKISEDSFRIGITHYAQDNLGDIVFIELPMLNKVVASGDSISVIESVKAVSDVYSPMSGVILQVNVQLSENVALINQSPFKEGWLCTITAKKEELSLLSLLTYQQYQEYLKTL